MKHSTMLSGAAALAAVVVVAVLAYTRSPAEPTTTANDAAQHATAATPAAADRVATEAAPAAVPVPIQLQLVSARRFRVAQPFPHRWSADQPPVRTGWLMVVEGPSELLRPRQAKEPVLYVGAQTADRVNWGLSGRLVLIVPGDFRLEDAPIFLGPEALPEELRQRDIDAALADAIAGGAVAVRAAKAAELTAAEPLNVANEYELRQRAIDLVEQHSPDEKDLISGWRAPLVK